MGPFAHPAVTMDIKMLLRLLHDVRSKWYNIGIELDISTGTLDAIKAQNSDCDGYLREMIKHWLSMKSHKATFDDIVEALSSELVGEMALAENTRSLQLTLTSSKGISAWTVIICMQCTIINLGVHEYLSISYLL